MTPSSIDLFIPYSGGFNWRVPIHRDLHSDALPPTAREINPNTNNYQLQLTLNPLKTNQGSWGRLPPLSIC
jgi:hypothetical protein